MSFYLAMVTAEQNVHVSIPLSASANVMLCVVWLSEIISPEIYSHKTLNSDHILFLENLTS